MKRTLFVTTLIAMMCGLLMIVLAFAVPSVTMLALQAAEERTIWENEHLVFNDGSELSLSEKCMLICGDYVTLYNGSHLSEQEVRLRTETEFGACADMVGFSFSPASVTSFMTEARLYITGQKTAVLWYTALTDENGAEYEGIIDDETGLLLSIRAENINIYEKFKDNPALSDSSNVLSIGREFFERLGMQISQTEALVSKNSTAVTLTVSDWVSSADYLVRVGAKRLWLWPAYGIALEAK